MFPPKIQPDHSRDRDPLALAHREVRPFSQHSIQLRNMRSSSPLSNQVRNYVQTIEGDMNYIKQNQPLDGGSHAVPK